MTVNFNGFKYRVSWRYVSEWTTTCDVKEESGLLCGHGATVRSIQDRPCKEKARKVSLARALSNSPKEFRTQVWKSYFERKGK